MTSKDIFVIVGKYSGQTYALPSDYSCPKAIAVTLTADGNYISSEVADNLKWNADGSSNSYVFYPNGIKTRYLYCNKQMNYELGVGTQTSPTKFGTRTTSGLNKIVVLKIQTLAGKDVEIKNIKNKTEWCATSSSNTEIGFYKYLPDALQPTTTSFGYKSKKEYTFNAGVLKGFVKPVATAKTYITDNDLTEHIIYSSSNRQIVEVNSETGELTFTNTKFGTAKIEAYLRAGDNYKSSSDYYTVNNIDPRIEDTDFKFGRDGYTVALESSADGIATFSAKGALLNPNGLDVTYSLSPASDDATIDETGGGVSVKKRGTYTVTATGAANETYKEATATCTLKVTNGISVVEKTVCFTPGYIKGQASAGVGVEMSSGPVTVNSLNAELAKTDKYTFYGTTHTISSRIGKIVKIEFYGKDSEHPLTVFDYKGTEGTLAKEDFYACWDGYATKAVFTASSTAYVTQIDVTLEIPPLKTYTIDETKADNLVEDYRNADITIKRSLSADHWNTLCLPFNLSSGEVVKYFGEGTQLREYQGKFSNNTATFVPVYSIEAGKPYIMKPGNNIVEDPTFTGVSMVTTRCDADNNPLPVGDRSVFQMKGIYNQTVLKTDKTELFLGDGNLFYYPVEEDIEARTMDGMRAYFIVPKSTDTKKLRANINGNVTQLTHIFATEESDTTVYNMTGQRVGNSLNSLKRGVYILNRKKKVVVK